MPTADNLRRVADLMDKSGVASVDIDTEDYHPVTFYLHGQQEPFSVVEFIEGSDTRNKLLEIQKLLTE